MRLESITVRHYRVHRECHLELDPARTLIGGPNESGKSTLIEAAQRALFLRATTGGEVRKSMVSHLHGGHPEVEVCFAARGRHWRVQKRFSGPGGTATLTEIGGTSWSGDEAEQKLSALLGSEVVTGAAARRVGEQWAHLWVWQGASGADPTAHANTQSRDLLARLQSEGGAAAVQSPGDQRVADTLARQFDALFTDRRDPRAGSPLAQSCREEEEARATATTARSTCERLERAVADFAAAETALAAARAALAQFQPQQLEVETQLGRVATLRAEEMVQAPAAAAALEKHETAATAEQRIARLRIEQETAAKTLAPLEAETELLVNAEKARREVDGQMETAWQQALEAARASRLRHEWAAAQVLRIEKAATRDQLAARRQQVTSLRAELAALEAALAQIPAVAAAKLRALQKLESELSQASAARDAMAAGLEVLATDTSIRIGLRTLEAGDVEILTEQTEIEVGPSIRLRIRPGGGDRLVEARDRVRTTSEHLRRDLDALGLTSVEAAAQALARRQQIDAEIQTKSAQLAAFGAETIEKELAAAEQQCAAATADAERRAALLGDATPPADLETARAHEHRAASQSQAAECQESAASAARKTATGQLRQATEKLEDQRASLQHRKQEAATLSAQCQAFLAEHGGDEARAARLALLLGERTRAQAALETTRSTLTGLQPTLLERDRERLARAAAQHGAAQRDAEERRAVARGELQRDGTTDPQAELALAEERLLRATERREREERQAGAIALLHELFLAEQKTLADLFTRPLAARISAYLESLFGPGARAEVTCEGTAFSGLRLLRPAHDDQAIDFEKLSGGTREQLAAAVRLALAEVLATAHDGCLPVLFDDAFAYSDPDRVQTLQRMLDIAAGRGLQIIVLTCTPADYAALGARSVTLRIDSTARQPAAPPAGESHDGGLAANLATSGESEISPARRDAFLTALQTLDGSSGNIALRRHLHWDGPTYEAVKRDLLASGRVKSGAGKGGSVTLVTAS